MTEKLTGDFRRAYLQLSCLSPLKRNPMCLWIGFVWPNEDIYSLVTLELVTLFSLETLSQWNSYYCEAHVQQKLDLKCS